MCVYIDGDTERGLTMRRSNSRTIDPSSRASLLAREMEEAAVRYAQMTEQIDSVLSADRLRRRDAWTRHKKLVFEPARISRGRSRKRQVR